MLEMQAEGCTMEEIQAELKKFVLWGHSHVNMGVSPSGQDVSQFDEFSDGGHRYYFRMIANKKGECKIDLIDNQSGYQFNDIPWFIWDFDYTEIAKEIKSNIDANVKKKIYKYQGTTYGNHTSTATGTGTGTTGTTTAASATNKKNESANEIKSAKSDESIHFADYLTANMELGMFDMNNTAWKNVNDIAQQFTIDEWDCHCNFTPYCTDEESSRFYA